MSKLKITPKRGTGRTVHVTPQSAGWTYVGFDMWELADGQTATIFFAHAQRSRI
jgi:5-deoxy-glucuronate isomerase